MSTIFSKFFKDMVIEVGTTSHDTTGDSDTNNIFDDTLEYVKIIKSIDNGVDDNGDYSFDKKRGDVMKRIIKKLKNSENILQSLKNPRGDGVSALYIACHNGCDELVKEITELIVKEMTELISNLRMMRRENEDYVKLFTEKMNDDSDTLLIMLLNNRYYKYLEKLFKYLDFRKHILNSDSGLSFFNNLIKTFKFFTTNTRPNFGAGASAGVSADISVGGVSATADIEDIGVSAYKYSVFKKLLDNVFTCVFKKIDKHLLNKIGSLRFTNGNNIIQELIMLSEYNIAKLILSKLNNYSNKHSISMSSDSIGSGGSELFENPISHDTIPLQHDDIDMKDWHNFINHVNHNGDFLLLDCIKNIDDFGGTYIKIYRAICGEYIGDTGFAKLIIKGAPIEQICHVDSDGNSLMHLAIIGKVHSSLTDGLIKYYGKNERFLEVINGCNNDGETWFTLLDDNTDSIINFILMDFNTEKILDIWSPKYLLNKYYFGNDSTSIRRGNNLELFNKLESLCGFEALDIFNNDGTDDNKHFWQKIVERVLNGYHDVNYLYEKIMRDYEPIFDFKIDVSKIDGIRSFVFFGIIKHKNFGMMEREECGYLFRTLLKFFRDKEGLSSSDVNIIMETSMHKDLVFDVGDLIKLIRLQQRVSYRRVSRTGPTWLDSEGVKKRFGYLILRMCLVINLRDIEMGCVDDSFESLWDGLGNKHTLELLQYIYHFPHNKLSEFFSECDEETTSKFSHFESVLEIKKHIIEHILLRSDIKKIIKTNVSIKGMVDNSGLIWITLILEFGMDDKAYKVFTEIDKKELNWQFNPKWLAMSIVGGMHKVTEYMQNWLKNMSNVDAYNSIISYQDERGYTTLMHIINGWKKVGEVWLRPHLELFKLIWNNNFYGDVLMNLNGENMIMMSAKMRDKWLFKKILKGYRTINLIGRTVTGDTLLHLVAQWGDDDIMYELLKRDEYNGVKIDTMNSNGDTLLKLFFKNGLNKSIGQIFNRSDVTIAEVLDNKIWVKYMYNHMYDEFIKHLKIDGLTIDELKAVCYQYPDDEKLNKLLVARQEQSKINDEIVKRKTKCCDICMEEYTEKWVIIPCGHTNCCKTCLDQIDHSGRKKCPKCRGDITSVMRIFD